MGVRKTSLTIDEGLLDAARRALATRTVRETVEEALREVVRVRARREEVEVLSTLRGLDLADDEIMSGAWGA